MNWPKSQVKWVILSVDQSRKHINDSLVASHAGILPIIEISKQVEICVVDLAWGEVGSILAEFFFPFFLPFNEPRRQGISLFACFVDSLWQRARNVSFRISLQWPIYITILIHKTILCLSCCCCCCLFVCSFVCFFVFASKLK